MSDEKDNLAKAIEYRGAAAWAWERKDYDEAAMYGHLYLTRVLTEANEAADDLDRMRRMQRVNNPNSQPAEGDNAQ
ncbi:MAG: hypothetical protein ACLFVH_13175 [Phycisphaerae bacterium]